MTEYKFYFGCSRYFITAECARNAVLKFRQLYNLSNWTVWYVLPKENTFICIRDYILTDNKGVLYYDCDVKPVY